MSSTRRIEAHLSCMGDTNLVTLVDFTERKLAKRHCQAKKRSAVFFRMLEWAWSSSTLKGVISLPTEHFATISAIRRKSFGKDR